MSKEHRNVGPATIPSRISSRVVALVFFLLLVCGCRSESDAVKAYRTFATAYLNGEMAKAQGLSTGAASQRLQNMINPPAGQNYVLPLKETVRQVHSVAFKVEEETPDASGVALRVRIDTKIDRPGTHSTGGSEKASFEHVAHLSKDGDGWRVDSFEDREVR